MDPVLRTKILIVANIVIAILYDILTYKIDGNEATISRVTLHFASKYPILGVPLIGGVLLLLSGILIGHLFFPQHVKDAVASVHRTLLGKPGE